MLEKEEYAKRIAHIELMKSGAAKFGNDYRFLKSYDVLEVDGLKKLIYPVSSSTASILYYVCEDELFDILLSTHVKLDHSGRNRMLHEIKTKYRNIIAKQIQTFVDLCEPCEQEKSGVKRGVVVKLMVFPKFNSRGQIDLIDMQAQADGEFKFIFLSLIHI